MSLSTQEGGASWSNILNCTTIGRPTHQPMGLYGEDISSPNWTNQWIFYFGGLPWVTTVVIINISGNVSFKHSFSSLLFSDIHIVINIHRNRPDTQTSLISVNAFAVYISQFSTSYCDLMIFVSQFCVLIIVCHSLTLHLCGQL